MKIFITYASVGAGHHRTAQALYNYLGENLKTNDLRLIDALEYSNKVFKFLCTSGYSFLVSKTPSLWGFFFWITNFRSLRVLTRTIARICNWSNTKRFSNFLIRESPDFIISTHFLPTEIVSNLKRSKKVRSNLITVVTDFILHPYWISYCVDTYVVATELTKQQLIKEGVSDSQVKVLGLPVSPKFLVSLERGEIFKKLGIKSHKFTVMILTGSFGIGPIERIVELLQGAGLRLIVVCAGNRKLYSRLKKKNLSDVLTFSFVENIQELMAISDMIITKPGGSTITEILIMELAPIFISLIPGQEAGNAQILQSYGIGILPKSVKQIRDLVLDFRDHPEKLTKIKSNIRKIRKPDVLSEVASVICKGSSRPSG